MSSVTSSSLKSKKASFVTPRKNKSAEEEEVSPLKSLASPDADNAAFEELSVGEITSLLEKLGEQLDTRDCVPESLTYILTLLNKSVSEVTAAVRKSNGRADGELVECVYAVAMHKSPRIIAQPRNNVQFKVNRAYFQLKEISDVVDTVFKPVPDNGVDLFYIECVDEKYVFHYIQVKHGMTQVGYRGVSTYSLSSIRRRLGVGRRKIEQWFPEISRISYEHRYHLYALGGLCEKAWENLDAGKTPVEAVTQSQIKKMLLSVMRKPLGNDLGNLAMI